MSLNHIHCKVNHSQHTDEHQAMKSSLHTTEFITVIYIHDQSNCRRIYNTSVTIEVNSVVNSQCSELMLHLAL